MSKLCASLCGLAHHTRLDRRRSLEAMDLLDSKHSFRRTRNPPTQFIIIICLQVD